VALCPIQGREEKEITADTKENLPLMNADLKSPSTTKATKEHEGQISASGRAA